MMKIYLYIYIYISPELRQKIIDGLRLKEENCWWVKIKGRKLIS